MLFSNPDYPIFLIAVFFLYAVSRIGDARGFWARAALLVLLGDLVFLLVAKDIDALWDPLGSELFRSLTRWGHTPVPPADPITIFVKWPLGLGVIAGAIELGRRIGPWLASDRGQRMVARGLVGAVGIIGCTVAVASSAHVLEPVTRVIGAHAHLLFLAILGIGIGLTRDNDHRPLARVIVLFVASSLFYQAWAIAMPGPYRYLLGLLLGTIILDYYLALWIEASTDPATRKLLVIVSLVSNLGILFFFKYADFVTHDVMHLPVSRMHLILPAGISFHTFQSLSYTIDVYRKELRATRSPIEFATFVLFFPQLVAGPIVRAQDLLPQLHDLPAMELEKATRGLFRIVVGLFKKIALADTFALYIVDRVFENPSNFSSVEVLVGVYAYALQIYCDFSAYSDIAIGSADLIGFTLPENFRTPYRSANLQEFWRRWHISLSTWLRDYLYITLGGSRGSAARTYLNLIVTMVLGGLWHGASWTFVVWGALHGLGLAITRYFQRATAADGRAAWPLLGMCAALAAGGYGVLVATPRVGTWQHLAFAWVTLMPLWAVVTAWVGRDREALPELPFKLWVPEILRWAMCASGVMFLVALQWFERWTWIPLVLLTWLLAFAADVIERGGKDLLARTLFVLRRRLAVLLTFHYVCLAWIFFRASSFGNALAVLRQIAARESDHPNLVPVLTTALVVGFACHFFADGSFRWLRERWAGLHFVVQAVLLVAVVLVLRELAHPKVVPFIYFQF